MIDQTGVGGSGFAASTAFHAGAPGAVGTGIGSPGIRACRCPNYHGAFAHDPDGPDIEAVCHEPEDNR